MKKLTVLGIVLLLATSIFGAYQVGDRVDNFTLTDCDGNTVNLYDYYSEQNGGTQFVVFLNFSEPWCGPCQAEAAHLEQVYQDYGPDHFIIFTIGSDFGSGGNTTCQQWIDTYGLTFQVLNDNIGLYGDYGDGYVPYNTVLDADMVVQYTNSGWSESAVRNAIEAAMENMTDDIDEDGIVDEEDNCPNAYNPEQSDVDEDGFGDLCDSCMTTPIPGDVIQDSLISVNDIVRTVSVILNMGNPPSFCELEGADANLDGKINVTDIIWMVNQIMGKIALKEEEMILLLPKPE